MTKSVDGAASNGRNVSPPSVEALNKTTLGLPIPSQAAYSSPLGPVVIDGPRMSALLLIGLRSGKVLTAGWSCGVKICGVAGSAAPQAAYMVFLNGVVGKTSMVM